MSIEIKEKVMLNEYTTLQVGGAARYFVSVSDTSELEEAVVFAKDNGLDIKILGGGSNVLVGDEGFSGLVIKNEIKGLEVVNEDDETLIVRVGAGEVLDEFISKTVEKGWWGVENLSHIPGTVGAVPIQNVGAYGVEASDVVKSVEVYSLADNSYKELSASDCQFGYRDSLFKKPDGKDYIVLSVDFSLSKQPKPVLGYRDLAQTFPEGTEDQLKIREAVVAIRSQKFPDWHEVGTAGSFFKNPIVSQEKAEEIKQEFPELPVFSIDDGRAKLAMGYILDKVCGLKGYREGVVATYSEQALVLINEGGATAKEIEDFANKILSQVEEETGIKTEWEVTKW